MLRNSCFAVLLAMSLPAFASPAEHPLFKRFPDATVTHSQEVAHERFRLPTGLPPAASSLDFPSRQVTGDLLRHSYRVAGVSTLKLYENYRAAMEQANLTIVFQCGPDDCGNQRQVQTLGAQLAVTGNIFNFWRNPYYLLGVSEDERLQIGVFIGGHEGDAAIQQVVVTESDPPLDLIEIDLSYLNRRDAEPTATPELSAEERARDHALLSRYPGARIRERRHREYEPFTLPLEPVQAHQRDGDFRRQELVGDLTQHFYELERVSTLKVYENYKAALSSADFEILFECAHDACGTSADVRALGGRLATTGNVFNFHRSPFYLVARRMTVEGPAYIALFIGGYNQDVAVQQVVVETRDIAANLIEVNADLLHRELQDTGRVSLYGIQFDTNRSEVKPESKAALDSLAELLREHPELQVYVVGHTDDVGAVDYNRDLSSARAKAVVDVLVRDYDVSASRLHSAGVGPFAPTASNATEEGRALNRRVELVTRQP
jgi:outer membrane protein OmpA-like peptidoglycan-associated protein